MATTEPTQKPVSSVPTKGGFYDAEDHPGMLNEALPPFAWNTWKTPATCASKRSRSARPDEDLYDEGDHPGLLDQRQEPFAWNTWKPAACAP